MTLGNTSLDSAKSTFNYHVNVALKMVFKEVHFKILSTRYVYI